MNHGQGEHKWSQSMSKMVAIDVDNTIANLYAEWLNRYNKDYNDTLTPEALVEWDLSVALKPECGDKIFSYLLQPDLYEHVKPMERAADGVNEIRRAGHKVVFLTSCVPGTEKAKIEWLITHGFMSYNKFGNYKEFISAHDKSLIVTDVLIDDRSRNLSTFKGEAICFDQPHNRYYDCRRMMNWSEKSVAEVLLFLDGKYNFGKTISDEAKGLVYGNRRMDYGHPIDDYTRTGMIFGAILSEWAKKAATSKEPLAVPPELAALCMVGVKMSREVNKPKRDNRVDGCGYWEVVDLIQQRK